MVLGGRARRLRFSMRYEIVARPHYARFFGDGRMTHKPGILGRSRSRAAPIATHEEDPCAVERLARPSIRVYDDRDGLPMNSVTALALDREGYLWVGTQDGAAYYNGRSWTRVDFPTRTLSNWVRHILADSVGNVWFATSGGGLLRLRDGRWTVFDTSSGLPHNTVVSLLETRGKAGPAILVGTGNWLARVEGDVCRPLERPASLGPSHVSCLLETAPSTDRRVLWVGVMRKGLARLEGGVWTVVDRSSGLPHDSVLSLLETRGEGGPVLWAGTYGGGLARLEAGRWTATTVSADGLPNDTVKSLLATSDGAVWAGTDDGLGRFEGGTWRVFDTSSGLPNSGILCLLETRHEDGAAALWAGTFGGGLVRLGGGSWRSFVASPGLPNGSVMCLAEVSGPSGKRAMWMGTDAGELARLERGEWHPVVPSIDGCDVPLHTIAFLLETRSGDGNGEGRTLWVGTSGGLLRLENGSWSLVDAASGSLPQNFVMCLLETQGDDGRPVLWVGTNGGLARVRYDEGGEWRVFDMTSPGGASHGGAALKYKMVTSLVETRDDGGEPTLWVGTMSGGLAALRGVRQRFFGVGSEGADAGIPNDSISSVCEARGVGGVPTLWVGTMGGGVAWRPLRGRERPWSVLSDATDPALPNNTVYQIRQDRQGRIYLFTNKGVARLTPKESRAPDGGGSAQSAQFSVQAFTTEDGLPSLECNQNAAAVDSLGRIWVGTNGGVAVLDPSRETPDRAPKRLRVERVLVNDAPRDLASAPSLTHDENDLIFEYALLSYFREADTRYRTQLAGYDRAPSEWNAEPRRVYTNLPEGPYAFTVWGRDYAGNLSGPVEVRFRIKPAPYRTWWAYTLYAGTAAGLTYLGVRARTRALRRRGEELEATVAERTTALAASEERALASEHAALEASKAKSVFLSSMSHELRTPLNAVIGFAQLLEREGGLDPSQRESVAAIARSGEHLLGLINDVLSIAKIEAGKLTLDEENFDLSRVLLAVEEMVRVRARARGLVLTVEVSPDLPRRVRGDEGKLRQVLVNLLGNAVKFTERGTVTLRAAWHDGVAHFEVEDTGPGIPAEALSKLFEPFVQTESGRKAKEGTGLGLAISRDIVRRMGGEIAVASAVGAGTTFHFDVRLPPAGGEWSEEDRRVVIGLVPQERGREEFRILVVDDSSENRNLLVKLLAPVGFVVRAAADGAEAIEVWQAWRPHLIWMDIRMAGMDGREAARRIRNDECRTQNDELKTESDGGHTTSDIHHSSRQLASIHHSTKIVALTASAFEHEREEILAAGCDDFVAKPFRQSVIFEKLAEHLGVRYTYADERGRAGVERAGTALVPERLAALPAELVAALETALVVGSDLGAHAVAGRIAEFDNQLAVALTAMIEQVQFDEILDLIERTRL
jgi:signal transduction histidine kinase/CheY-like chemotaxis protein/ligand-binding sensor domain-containing protein